MILVSATARMGCTPGANGPDFGLDFLGGQRRRGDARKPVCRREQAINPATAQLGPEQVLQGTRIEQSARFGFTRDAIRQPEPDLELNRGFFRIAGHRQSLPQAAL